MPSTDPMRLRARVFTNPFTGKRYLVSMAIADIAKEQVHVYFMSDEETLFQAMSINDYNALPYFFFKEDGPAPKPEMRVADELRIGG